MKREVRGMLRVVAGTVLLVVSIAVPLRAEEPQHNDPEIAQGERMYRDGILPSGKPMTVKVEGGASLPGTAFACGSCHNRSGIAVMDNVQRTPSVNGPSLFRPLYHFYPALSEEERAELPERFKTPPLRPAYTDETLATAIRAGIDPNGRRFNDTMPRYNLDNRDMATLIKYLKQLSATTSPGVTDATLALATVVTDDVSEQDQRAMLDPLDKMVRTHNALGGGSGNMTRMLSMQVMSLTFREYTLAHWTLHGPPETWREQLENFYRATPVFALVGGISNSAWNPVHDFCEEHQLPCILPITDLPEISSSEHYTLYFSQGHYQEGQAAARYLASQPGMSESANVVQVLDAGPAAKALAAGFEDAWKIAEGKPIKTVRLTKDEALNSAELLKSLPSGKNSTLVLWLGPESYDVLRSLAKSVDHPRSIVLSSTLLAERIWALPPEVRPFTYIVYPFREPGPKTIAPKMGGRPLVVNKEFRKNDRRIGSKTATTLTLLNRAIAQLERNFYRDYLLDVFDAMDVEESSDYEQLNFGPRRRYLSDHCYIMQMSDGADPKLSRVADLAE